ncbi:MAG: RNA 3'-terminal phosphate cyclase [Anaerolineae bacterium]|jgi:RNA 3'-terminal phosphate cyclase (ATP)
MIVVDGSLGEGGGQVLRTALTLAILTREPTRIERIRAGRRTPGLRPQHLTAVQAAATICGAEVEGAELESQTLSFVPSEPARAGTYSFDVEEAAERGSAGSVGLILQAILLPLALSPGESHITLRGGTHVPWAPSADYLRAVFLPTVAQMGLRAELELTAWGFYPAGGGEIRVLVRGQSTPLKPIELTQRGKAERIWGRGVASNLPSHIPQRMVNRARNLLSASDLKADLEALRVRGAGPGAGIFLAVEYEHALAGFTAHGRKGLPAEQVAQAVCEALLNHHRTSRPADPHLADQLILPMALASGRSQVVTSAITGHLLTNLETVRSFLPIEARVEGEKGKPGTITITGYTDD